MRAISRRRLVYTLRSGTHNQHLWGMGLCSQSNSYVLANAAMVESCTMADYARVISETLGKRPITLSVPYAALKVVSVGVMFLSKLFNFTTSLHPRRVEKLKINNHIKPRTLIESGYQYRYSLASAMADWKTEYPDGGGDQNERYQ